MTKIRTLITVLSSILVFSCNNSQNADDSTNQKSVNKKAAKEIIKIDTVQVNKTASTFYAICADEHFGWCSQAFNSYDEANTALTNHKNSTGHTDNTVSNNCPF